METLRTRRPRLGDILVSSGKITAVQLQQALSYQQEHTVKLGQALTELGFAADDDISLALSQQHDVPMLSLVDYPYDADLVHTFPQTLLQEYSFLPLSLSDSELAVTTSDPTNLALKDELRRRYPHLRLVLTVSYLREIQQVLSDLFGVNDRLTELTEMEIAVSDFDTRLDIDENTTADDSPVVNFVNGILTRAVRYQASDIHLGATENKTIVKFRMDGVLHKISEAPKHVHRPLLARLKNLSGMDVSEKRLPQDGSIQMKLDRRDIDLRVSTLPTVTGEKLVIRIFDKDNLVLQLDKLNFPSAVIASLRANLRRKQGMIIVVGPTGAGKSSTLYSALHDVNDGSRCIITIEEPVEYVLEGTVQVNIKDAIGLDFATALVASLRQDPDIIMVGEVRDVETAETAIQAAHKGHLVLTTLHSGDACGSIAHLLQLGVLPTQAAASVLCVVAQQLVRKLCPHCRQADTASEQAEYAVAPAELSGPTYHAVGCKQCRDTGYRGRLPLVEYLSVTQEIAQVVVKGAYSKEILAAARAQGFQTFRDQALAAVNAGLTSLAEVEAFIGKRSADVVELE